MLLRKELITISHGLALQEYVLEPCVQRVRIRFDASKEKNQTFGVPKMIPQMFQEHVHQNNTFLRILNALRHLTQSLGAAKLQDLLEFLGCLSYILNLWFERGIRILSKKRSEKLDFWQLARDGRYHRTIGRIQVRSLVRCAIMDSIAVRTLPYSW